MDGMDDGVQPVCLLRRTRKLLPLPATLLLLSQEDERQPLQYLNAFVRMYGADAVEAASAALSGEEPFYGLHAVDNDLKAFPAHQSLLNAYEKLQKAKAAYWSK